MKKYLIFLIFFTFIMNVVAQNKKIIHKIENNFMIPGNFILVKDLHGTFDYNYYEDDRGNYVKHGNFSIKGSATHEVKKRNGKDIYTETYYASGKYVDGWLDGTLTITHRYQLNNQFQEWSLTANFKNGLPHGEWKNIYKDAGTSNTHAICHFNEGQMVGKVDFDWYGGNNGDFTNSHTKYINGELDQEGRNHGKWIEKYTDGSTKEYEFEHGVTYKCLIRNKQGEVVNIDDQDPELIQKSKEAAIKYSHGEISVDELKKQGFRVDNKNENRGDVVLDFFESNEIFIGKMIGGQKPLPENNQYYFGAPRQYSSIQCLRFVPDEMMDYMISKWKFQAESYRNKGYFLTIKRPSYKEELSRLTTNTVNAIDFFNNSYSIEKYIIDYCMRSVTGDSLFSITPRNTPDKEPGGFYQWSPSTTVEVYVCSINDFQGEKKLYMTTAQIDTMNSMARKIQTAATEYFIHKYAGKYHTTIPDPQRKQYTFKENNREYTHYLNKNHYPFIGYYKKDNGIQGCERFILEFYPTEVKVVGVEKINTVWDTIEQLYNVLTMAEEQLKKTDEDCYGLYKQKNTGDVITEDAFKSRENIAAHMQIVGNFQAFTMLKNNIIDKDLKIRRILFEKTEYAKILENYEAFYNTIDFSIHDATAKTDLEYLNSHYQNLLKFDTIIDLHKTYYKLVDSIKTTINNFEHFNLFEKSEYAKILENYKAFYNTFDYTIHDETAKTDIERLNGYFQELIKFDTIIDLHKTYYNLIDSIELTIKKFGYIEKTFHEYKETLQPHTDINSIEQLKAILVNLRKTQAYLQSTDLKSLNKTIKSAKEQSERNRLLIGE